MPAWGARSAPKKAGVSVCREGGVGVSGHVSIPGNPGAEEAVIGGILHAGALGHRSRVGECLEVRLEPDCFYRQSHGLIYGACVAVEERGDPPAPLLVIEELRRRGSLDGVGGEGRVHLLCAGSYATANCVHYAGLAVSADRRRKQLECARRLELASRNGGLDADPGLREELQAIIDAPAGAASAPALKGLDLGELLAGPVPEIDWLWKGWLARDDLSLLVGEPGVGKSLLALALADAVRRGTDLLGEECAKGRAGIIDIENPLSEVHRRLRAIGLTSNDHDGLVYVHMPALDLETPAGQRDLGELVRRHELDLLVIDSLRRAAPKLDENDAAKVSGVMSPLRALSATSGLTILVVHHSRKRGEHPTGASQMVRGSGDLTGSVDMLLYARATKKPDEFTLERGKKRRRLPHETILARIEDTDNGFKLTNTGPATNTDDKTETMLAEIIAALRNANGPLERQTLALRVSTDTKDGTFTRALNLGYQRDQLAKDSQGVGKPTFYALAEQQC